MQQRLVQDLMRIRHGHVVPETATLRQVAERLIISDCDMMAVIDTDGRFSGVVCESSVVRALMTNPAANATIQSIVCRHAESIRLDACLSTVLPLFRSSANTALPVIDQTGLVCGLLMRRDVIGNLLNRQAEAAMSAATESAASDHPQIVSLRFRLVTSQYSATTPFSITATLSYNALVGQTCIGIASITSPG